jgi:hypothetical protein
LPAASFGPEILDLARREKRVINTQELDFSAGLALAGFKKPRLITLRMSIFGPKAVTRPIGGRIERKRNQKSPLTGNSSWVIKPWSFSAQHGSPP